MTLTMRVRWIRGPAGRRAGAALVVVGVAAVAGVSGDAMGVRERLGIGGSSVVTPRPAAVSRTVGEGSAPAPATVLRSEPWWQSVTTLEGAGGASPQQFTIAAGALQWRVRWSCDHGRLLIRASDGNKPIVDAACPGPDIGYATQIGAVSLQVSADGPYKLQIDQQVDVPLTEPPLPAMTAANAMEVARGALYNVDQSGSGRVTIYRLGDGSHALRLDDFFVTPNTDLEIRLSVLPSPRSTDQYTGAPSATVAPLDITAGSMNVAVPGSVDPGAYKSVVIWCQRLHSVYAAAALTPGG